MIFKNIIISYKNNPNAWGVVCLTFETDTPDAPNVWCIDGIQTVKVAWAYDKTTDYPIYLQVTDMSESKQKFALRTAFESLRVMGYKIERMEDESKGV
jgi:hypothetical protein